MISPDFEQSYLKIGKNGIKDEYRVYLFSAILLYADGLLY
jgi:hypothetical protein